MKNGGFLAKLDFFFVLPNLFKNKFFIFPSDNLKHSDGIAGHSHGR
jgi:hypothetical protein